MIIKTNLKEALRSLISAKQRSILALVGIIIGIGSVIGMVSIGNIVKQEALKQFLDMGVDIISINKEQQSKGTRGGFRFIDAMGLPESVPSIEAVAPYSTGSAEFSRGAEKKNIVLYGVNRSFFSINKLKVAQGRLITDFDEFRPFCVVGDETAKILRKSGYTRLIGEPLKLGGYIYIIVGILNKTPDGGGLRPDGINQSMITHISTASKTFAFPDICSILARIRIDADSDAVKKQVSNYFSTRTKDMGVRIQTAEEIIESMENQMSLFTILLGAIGSISLIVGGVGVMNVMLVSVTERRKEIGIRRALGAQREDVLSQFIIESTVLCILGGLLGILLGIGASYFFAFFSKWTFFVSSGAILLGFSVSAAVGIFFGYYPARQAALLDPIAALRA